MSRELLATLPAIARARGRRLYAVDGRRFLDLYADGGASVAGRREGAAGRVAKEAIDRGLASPFPGFWEERLRKAILAWLPGWAGVHFFASETDALIALAEHEKECVRDLANGAALSTALAAFRSRLFVELPYRAFRTDVPAAPDACAFGGNFALARLPVAPAFAVGAVLVKDTADIERLSGFIGDPASALALSASSRALSDFLAFAPSFDESRWARIDGMIGRLFRRSGPWLYPTYPEAGHRRVFAACLAAGILISPDWRIPSIVAPEFDRGEVAPLGAILP